jgi:hypothetical protein
VVGAQPGQDARFAQAGIMFVGMAFGVVAERRL